jgi:RNA polymerase sigma-70 factor (ECF subfamily)
MDMIDRFDEFVRAQLPLLRAHVARSARRYGLEPDDALQEALLRAYAARATFESEQHAVNWICRVAHDLLCDQRRSWYGRRVTAGADLPETALGTAPDPADAVVRRDLRREVARALAALPPAHRLLLWQHAVDGRSYADIARESARPLGTVRSIALRARAVARQHLPAGEGALGLGAGLRLRSWWTRWHPQLSPNDVAAALLVVGLGLGTGAAPAHAMPAVPETPVVVVEAAAAPPRAAVVRPAGRAAGTAPAAATTPAESSAPAPAATEQAAFAPLAFTSQATGTCGFHGGSGVPFAVPLVVLEGQVDCALRIVSTTCTGLAGTAPDPDACSFSIEAEPSGDGLWLAGSDAVRKCSAADHHATLVFRYRDDPPVVAEAIVSLEAQKLAVQGSFDVRGERVTLYGEAPYVCADRIDTTVEGKVAAQR